MCVKKEEMVKVEAYLKKLFQREGLEVRQLPNKNDTAEVYIEDEFIATLYRDEEDGELAYQFQMSILDFDLQ
ncbi:MAG: DUF3126 family protein [Pseudomonadota bacterium]